MWENSTWETYYNSRVKVDYRETENCSQRKSGISRFSAMAKSYRYKSILLTIKQFHYYKELIKQPQVRAFQYYNNKKKMLTYMFPEKLFSHLINPNLGTQTCSYGARHSHKLHIKSRGSSFVLSTPLYEVSCLYL